MVRFDRSSGFGLLAERLERYNSAESSEDHYGYSNYASAF